MGELVVDWLLGELVVRELVVGELVVSWLLGELVVGERMYGGRVGGLLRRGNLSADESTCSEGEERLCQLLAERGDMVLCWATMTTKTTMGGIEDH